MPPPIRGDGKNKSVTSAALAETPSLLSAILSFCWVHASDLEEDFLLGPESVYIWPGRAVVVVDLAVDSAEAPHTVARERVHVVVARGAVDARPRRALVHVRLAAGTRVAGRTPTPVGTQSVHARPAVPTHACRQPSDQTQRCRLLLRLTLAPVAQDTITGAGGVIRLHRGHSPYAKHSSTTINCGSGGYSLLLLHRPSTAGDNVFYSNTNTNPSKRTPYWLPVE